MKRYTISNSAGKNYALGFTLAGYLIGYTTYISYDTTALWGAILIISYFGSLAAYYGTARHCGFVDEFLQSVLQYHTIISAISIALSFVICGFLDGIYALYTICLSFGIALAGYIAPIIHTIFYKIRSRRYLLHRPIVSVDAIKPSVIVQKKYKSPFLFSFLYAFGYIGFAWYVFVFFLHLQGTSINLLIPIALWFLAIPYYFLLKKHCDPIYPVRSFFSLLFVTIVWTNTYLAMDHLVSREIYIILFPNSLGFEGLIYLVPIFVAPIVGTIPLLIDLLLSIINWGIRRLAKRKTNP